jgi:hypothetical protein
LTDLSAKFFTAKLGDPAASTRQEIFESFKSGLDAAQSLAWKDYQRPELTLSELRRRLRSRSLTPRAPTEQDTNNIEARRNFEDTLSDEQKELFRREIVPWLEAGKPVQTRSHIALGALQQFIWDYVCAIGWHKELDNFDHGSILSHSDTEHRVERTGKKYQWIALYHLIGVLADNFQCAGDGYDSVGLYEGPWQIAYGRNIDPSLLIRAKPTDSPREHCWWSPTPYREWAEELDELEWLKRESDLPTVDKHFLIVKDAAQDEWFALEGHYEWTQPAAAGREHFELPQRQILYTVTSCLVRSKEASSVFNQMRSLDLPRIHSLEPRQISDPFLGEMHWAPVYMSQLRPYYGYEGWSKTSLPHSVLVTTEQYYAEPGSFDGSMDAAVRLICPSHWIVERMHLQWNGVEGEWCSGIPCRTIFRDPSARMPGPSALLASRKDLERFLKDEDCTIIWFVSGTKWAIGGGSFNRKPTGRRLVSGAIQLAQGGLFASVHSRLETPRR